MLARILTGMLFLGIASASTATPITVGPGCRYADLQAAIDSVGTTGTFEFHVRAIYVGSPISYSNKSIWIFGGYANCNDAAPIPFTGQNFDALSTIDGSRSPGNPGIRVSGPSRLALHNFQIHNATNPNGNGGGISYNGSGVRASLALSSVNINHNTAERGGGVFFRSTASLSESAMSIGDYTWIEFNTGTISGGGIRLEGNATLTANGNPASISNNTANPSDSDGAGGGLQLRDDTVANIGSPGWAGFAFIDHNHARAGGGVAVHNRALLNVYSTAAGNRGRIETNDAREKGGGVYVDASDGLPSLCVVGGGINQNRARDGTAVFVDTPDFDEHSASIAFEATQYACGVGALPGFQPCVPSQPCNTVDSNSPTDTSGVGGTIDVRSRDTRMAARYLAMRGNHGAFAIATTNASREIQLESCVIAANTYDNAIVWGALDGGLTVINCSIGGNMLAAGKPVFIGQDLSGSGTPLLLLNSVVWQPGHASFYRNGPFVVGLRNVILADATSLNPGDFTQYYNVSSPDPEFVNATSGDLHLRDLSPAIDAAATGTTMDLDMNPRGVDVPQSPGSPNLGPYDLGAYEVQHIDPQVPVTFPPDEDFDELNPINSLPANWQIVPGSGPGAWSLAATAADSGPVSAYVPDSPTAIDSSLTTLAFHVDHDGRLSFRHKVSLEFVAVGSNVAYDAAVLEIQIGTDPAFHDIIAAGGRFLTGGYDHVVTAGASLLAGRSAWSGTSDSFRSVVVLLPAVASGQDVKLRWRVATDVSFGLAGYWLDTIHVDVAGEPDDVIFANGFDSIQ